MLQMQTMTMGSASPTLLTSNAGAAYPISPGSMLTSSHQLPPTPTSLALMGPPSGTEFLMTKPKQNSKLEFVSC